MATRNTFLLLRRDMSMSTRTVGLPHHAIGRVKPRALPKNSNRGGASSAARARLAQVLSTVKEQVAQPPVQPKNPLASELAHSEHECPKCGASHSQDAPSVPAPTPDPIDAMKDQEPIDSKRSDKISDQKSKSAERIARAAAAAAPASQVANQSFVDMLPKITVMGVGGAGCNAVNNMITSGVQGVDFVAVNTDAQSLASSLAPSRIQIGDLGLGAGARPELGRQAAEDCMASVTAQIDGTHLLFITAGMGGGTGTGAASAIAQMARKRGVLTIGVVSTPWSFEGANRLRMAKAGISELEHCVDTLITIPNQNLMKINPKLSMDDALDMADSVLRTGVQGVTDLIVSPGLINLDFADVSTVTQNMGRAIMGTGEATGDGRATLAAESALRNPLLGDVNLTDSEGVLISVTGGNNMTLFEVDEVANRIREAVHPDATIIFGASFNEELEDTIRVSVICTGLRAGNFEETVSKPARRTALQKDAAKKAEAQDKAQGGLFGFLKSMW